MFWIGMIIGIIIGAVGYIAGSYLYTLKSMNMSWEEFLDYINIGIVAGNNRESVLTLSVKEGDEYECWAEVDFEEK